MTTIDIDPTTNPAEANAAVDKLMSGTPVEMPQIDLPQDNVVNLPGGLVEERFGASPILVSRIAEVRELNGADEESIAKAITGTPNRIMQTILRAGTVRIGETNATGDLLLDLLVGDREMLLLGIRRATYGDKVEMGGIVCPQCRELIDIELTLDEIPVRKLDNPTEDRYFEVPLRKGGVAQVRLPVGRDVEEAMSQNRTLAESNTILLSHCVLAIVDDMGQEEVVVGNRAAAASIGLVDRRAIIKEIHERQPGPRYDEVKFDHASCGKEVQVTVSFGDLFRDM